MRRILMTLALLLAVLLVPQAAGAATCDLGHYNNRFVLPANHRGVSAELGSDARLRARAQVPGPWERFRLVCLDGTNEIYAIRSVANGRYVSAEISTSGNDYAMLRARATAIGPWERFQVIKFTNQSIWTIKSMANNRYVSAELSRTGNQYGLLRARATVIGPWERFELVI